MLGRAYLDRPMGTVSSPQAGWLPPRKIIRVSNVVVLIPSRYIPGGVNSPVRAFRGVGGEPVFIERAAGSRIFDPSGRGYIDYVGSWGPMILGHAHRP